jgi:glycosyltransferase involved in cell wall biosynthesis
VRALFLTHTAPYPPVSGERIRNCSLMRALAEDGWRASLFSLAGGPPHPKLAELCDDVLLADAEPARSTRARRLLASVARRRAFHATAYLDGEAAARLHAWPALAAADVLVTSLYMYPYVPPGLRSRTVLDSHNVEARRLASMSAALGRSPRGLAARLQVGPVAAFEAEAVRSVARTLAVSEEERRIFEAFAPGRVDLVPNGVDADEHRFRASPAAGREILFVGSLDYGANVDAVRYLVGTVAPHLSSEGVRLTVVGSNPGRAVRTAAARASLAVDLRGHVPSVEEYFLRARAFAVPLRFGGGTRLKILEALARGVPVVTTTIGCEGLDLEPGEDLLVADDPAAFARSLDRLLADDDLCRRLAARGFQSVRDRYSWASSGRAFTEALARVSAA